MRRVNREALAGTGRRTLERAFNPLGRQRLVRLSLEALEGARASAEARREAERLTALSRSSPAAARLLLLAYASELVPHPLDSLGTYQALSERFDWLSSGDQIAGEPRTGAGRGCGVGGVRRPTSERAARGGGPPLPERGGAGGDAARSSDACGSERVPAGAVRARRPSRVPGVPEGGVRRAALSAPRARRPPCQRLPDLRDAAPELLPSPGQGRAIGAQHRVPRSRIALRMDLPDGDGVNRGAAAPGPGGEDDRGCAEAPLLGGRAGPARSRGPALGGAAGAGEAPGPRAPASAGPRPPGVPGGVLGEGEGHGARGAGDGPPPDPHPISSRSVADLALKLRALGRCESDRWPGGGRGTSAPLRTLSRTGTARRPFGRRG